MLSYIWSPVLGLAKTYWSYAAGFLFSTVLGHIFINQIVDSLWRNIGRIENEYHSDTLRPVQGYVERFLYTASYFTGHPSLIGLWPALKVASRWKEWGEKEGFSIFLTGTGLSIIYGVVGAQLIKWLANKEWNKSVVIGAGVLVLSFILKFWIQKQPKKQAKQIEEEKHKKLFETKVPARIVIKLTIEEEKDKEIY